MLAIEEEEPEPLSARELSDEVLRLSSCDGLQFACCSWSKRSHHVMKRCELHVLLSCVQLKVLLCVVGGG